MPEHRDGHRAKARPGPRRRGPAMTVDEARKAASSFYRAYFLHPLTWAPAVAAVGLMAIVGPASCGGHCMRALAKLRLGDGTDAQLGFWLLTLLALPFSVDLLWRQAIRLRFKEAVLVVLVDTLRFAVPSLMTPRLRSLLVALTLMFIALVTLVLGAGAGPPEDYPLFVDAFVTLGFCWLLWHLCVITSFHCFVQMVASWRLDGRPRR